jgi:signal transduction histidine kinase
LNFQLPLPSQDVGIAHDFNNILGIISGYTEMAQWDAAKGSQVWENLQEARTAIERATEQVQQILAFSRLRDNERQPFQVGLVVKEASLIPFSPPKNPALEPDWGWR